MKPASVKWINGLIFLKIGAAFLFLILGSIAIFTHPESGFFKGVEQSLGLRNLLVESDTAGTFGMLFGTVLIPVLLAAGIYFALKSRKKTLFYILISIDILASIGSGGFPLIMLVILILSLLKPTRNYLEINKSEKLT